MLLTAVSLIIIQAAAAEPAQPFPGQKSEWHGYVQYTFRLDERTCYVVVPKSPAPGMPWVWRARFWGHEPQTDLALLGHGFHVVYCDVAGLFGSPNAVKRWDAFYRFLTEEHGFARKAVLEGMSRGGLIIYNWAAKNADKVACIYADAPVCDIRSWPGGKGKSPGSPADWRKCLEAYGITEDEAETFKGNPIDHLEPLAEAGIPLLHICGGADKTVPFEENTAILAKRYRALGGDIALIVKEDCGHHPHSLEDPKPIVDFILKHTGRKQAAESAASTGQDQP